VLPYIFFTSRFPVFRRNSLPFTFFTYGFSSSTICSQELEFKNRFPNSMLCEICSFQRDAVTQIAKAAIRCVNSPHDERADAVRTTMAGQKNGFAE
jgi:hypothetical protein